MFKRYSPIRRSRPT